MQYGVPAYSYRFSFLINISRTYFTTPTLMPTSFLSPFNPSRMGCNVTNKLSYEWAFCLICFFPGGC